MICNRNGLKKTGFSHFSFKKNGYLHMFGATGDEWNIALARIGEHHSICQARRNMDTFGLIIEGSCG